jgi:hypothetical protein
MLFFIESILKKCLLFNGVKIIRAKKEKLNNEIISELANEHKSCI